MPIYVYETIPATESEPPRQFELRQSMADAALTHDPESGRPVRRVIQGGYLNTQSWTKGAVAPQRPATARGERWRSLLWNLRLRTSLKRSITPPMYTSDAAIGLIRTSHQFRRLDVAGSVLSTLCAIHCLAMPLVAGLLPVLGLNFLGNRAFERAACVAMTALATFCLLQGCQSHRRWWLLGLLGAGASLTLGTQFNFAADTAIACTKACCAEKVNWPQALVMFTGGGLIATSHLLNLWLSRACVCCANVPQTLAGSGGANALIPLIAAMGFFLAPSTRAAHSDILISRTNGVLHVDNTIHTGNVQENDASGNGTVWATDNPGFAGSGFQFNDEILFDITGPLKRWDGTSWSSANVRAEFMDFVEPGPFGDPIHSVTITRATTLAPGYPIAQIGTRGTLHTHFVFILRATNGVAPAVGAYIFPLTLRSPQYASAPPVHLVFNNGLEEAAFNTAVAEFQARNDVLLTLRATGGALTLRVPTLEGFSYQPLSAPTPSGPWTNLGTAIVGDGSVLDVPVALNPAPTFFRVLRHTR